jgi:hypothetical protein
MKAEPEECVAPPGLCGFLFIVPGLTPWASFCRASSALSGWPEPARPSDDGRVAFSEAKLNECQRLLAQFCADYFAGDDDFHAAVEFTSGSRAIVRNRIVLAHSFGGDSVC